MQKTAHICVTGAGLLVDMGALPKMAGKAGMDQKHGCPMIFKAPTLLLALLARELGSLGISNIRQEVETVAVCTLKGHDLCSSRNVNR